MSELQEFRNVVWRYLADCAGGAIGDRVAIVGHVEVKLFGPDGKLKYHGVTHNIVTDKGDALFASLAYTAAPTFHMKLGSAATVVSKTFNNNGAFIASANGDADYIAGSDLVMDATYPKVGGSANIAQFKRSWAAGVATGTLNRVSLVSSAEGTDPADGTLTFAIALLPDKPVTKGAADTLECTWNITHLGA